MTGILEALNAADHAALSQMVDEVLETGGPRPIQRDGKEVAMIVPIGLAWRLVERSYPEADADALLTSFGSWTGIVDAEAFKAANAESRRLPGRPPAEL